ncbi:hypothetical protein Efla_000515 [Eimeria flavescens]
MLPPPELLREGKATTSTPAADVVQQDDSLVLPSVPLWHRAEEARGGLVVLRAHDSHSLWESPVVSPLPLPACLAALCPCLFVYVSLPSCAPGFLPSRAWISQSSRCSALRLARSALLYAPSSLCPSGRAEAVPEDKHILKKIPAGFDRGPKRGRFAGPQLATPEPECVWLATQSSHAVACSSNVMLCFFTSSSSFLFLKAGVDNKTNSMWM